MNPDCKSDVTTPWPFELPSDGWGQLCPRGEFPGRDELTGKEVTQVIDQAAIDSMLAEFHRQSAVDNFAGLLIDYDHFSEDLDKPSIAAGWIIELQERPSGIWFRPRWSTVGESNLKSGCYRNISPSMRGEVIGKDRVRPLVIDRAGLTNDPNFKLMRPLSNRGGGRPTNDSHNTMEKKSMKSLLALLGLSPDASEDSAAAALTTLMNRDKTATADLATMKNRAETAETDLAKVNTATRSAEADAFCEKHKAKIKNREVIHAQYLRDPEGTTALVDGLEVGSVSLKNRKKQQPNAITDAREKTNAQALQAKVLAYKAVNRCSYQVAFTAVSSAHPELLTEPDDGSTSV